MREWPCELVAQAPRPELGQSIVFGSQKSGGACGTFQMRGNLARITYDPKMLDDPIGLIATFAHELCHYVLAGVTDPPGGIETIEPLTDLATVHLGFGLFGANTAFNFQQSTSYDRQGWSYSRAGYLSEAEWSFANAVFFEMRGAAPASYEPYAKSSVLSGIAKNRTFLKQNPKFIASLKSPHSHLRLV